MTVYEARPYVGGLAPGSRTSAGTGTWSASTITSSPATGNHRLREGVRAGRYALLSPTRTSIYYQGICTRLIARCASYSSSRCPSIDRLRFGAVAAFLRVNPFWRPFERVTAHEWLSRALGQRGYEILWQPLLEGKFGKYYKHVNLAWFWARHRQAHPQPGLLQGRLPAVPRRAGGQSAEQGAEITAGAPRARRASRSRWAHSAGTGRGRPDARARAGDLLPEHAPGPHAHTSRFLHRRPGGAEIHGRRGDGAGAQAAR